MLRPFRPRWLPALFGLVLMLVPSPPALAHSGQVAEKSAFVWDILSDHTNVSWRGADRDELEAIRNQYDGEILYFRDETGRYVVTDPDLVEEAKKAPREIEKHQDVIHSMAQAEARLSLAHLDHSEEIERLRQKKKTIDAEIQEREREGNVTEHLERKRFEISAHIEALEGMSRNTLTPAEEKSLIRQRDAARSKLKEVERVIDQKVRKIAETAKRKGLAERQP
jgi:hypothetical protein